MTSRYPISVRLTKDELDRLTLLAKERGTTRHDLLRQMVRAIAKLPTVKDILEIARDQ